MTICLPKPRISQFKETIQVGNLYNRLITYDAKVAHRPNNYAIDQVGNRLALLFVISDYRCWPRTYKIEDNHQAIPKLF